VISIEAGAIIEGKINHMSENVAELAITKKSSKPDDRLNEKPSEKPSIEKIPQQK
jgi:hypothetical protein